MLICRVVAINLIFLFKNEKVEKDEKKSGKSKKGKKVSESENMLVVTPPISKIDNTIQEEKTKNKDDNTEKDSDNIEEKNSKVMQEKTGLVFDELGGNSV